MESVWWLVLEIITLWLSLSLSFKILYLLPELFNGFFQWSWYLLFLEYLRILSPRNPCTYRFLSLECSSQTAKWLAPSWPCVKVTQGHFNNEKTQPTPPFLIPTLLSSLPFPSLIFFLLIIITIWNITHVSVFGGA